MKTRLAGFAKAFQCDRFEVQEGKGLSDHLAGPRLFLTVFFFFFPHGHSTSPLYPSPLQGRLETAPTMVRDRLPHHLSQQPSRQFSIH